MNINSGGEIYWDLDAAAGTVTITWDGVAPYNGSGANSFQIVLTDIGGGAVFNDARGEGARGMTASFDKQNLAFWTTDMVEQAQ